MSESQFHSLTDFTLLLPPEVLAYIFKLGKFSIPDNERPPLEQIVIKVSSYWRGVAVETSQLWNYIHVERWDKLSTDHRLECYLRWSGELRLHLRLKFPDIEPCPTVNVLSALDRLISHQSRWQHLVVQLESESASPDLARGIRMAVLTPEVSRLETLSWSDTSTVSLSTTNFPCPPTLHSLRVRALGWRCQAQAATSVTTLHLNGVLQLAELSLRSFLEGFVSLKVLLMLIESIHVHMGVIEPITPLSINLGSLHFLRVEKSRYQTAALAFVPALAAPNLDILHVISGPNSNSFSEEALGGWCASFPSIRTLLALSNTPIINLLAKFMSSPRPSHAEYPWPRLQILASSCADMQALCHLVLQRRKIGLPLLTVYIPADAPIKNAESRADLEILVELDTSLSLNDFKSGSLGWPPMRFEYAQVVGIGV